MSARSSRYPGSTPSRLLLPAATSALALAVGAPVAMAAPAAAAGSGSPASSATASAAPSAAARSHRTASRHVLLISVDGLHQSDLDWYVRTHRDSTLARLVGQGVDFARARTPFPSDSFPGMAGQVTGGNPGTTGVYYDVSYNRSLLAPGTTTCSGAARGTAVAYDETIDKDPSRLDAGQGLKGLPGSILSMTGNPRSVIDPAKLPVDPKTCTPVFPHSYLKVDTIFEVAHRARLRTAWSDKHAAYDLVNGPSGKGVDDLFTPEINSDSPNGSDWTKTNSMTRRYDDIKVAAVLNEIDGYDHSRSHRVGIPAIFGMNFQSVSTAQKLPSSDGQAGGYRPGTRVPGPVLTGALEHVDTELGRMTAELRRRGLSGSTTIIVSAKHGQSPIDPSTLRRLDDAPIIDGINKAWAAKHPGAADLVAAASDDDGMLLWLSDRSKAATSFVRSYLLSHVASGTNATGGAVHMPASGLRAVLAGGPAARLFGVSTAEDRHPDVVGLAVHGVVFTGGTKKIAEHGGADWEDRNVPIIVSGAGVTRRGRVRDQVETTSIAPTILRALGLAPSALAAVRIEHTRALRLR